MEATSTKLNSRKPRSKRPHRCVRSDPQAYLDQVIAGWPGLGRPLLPETELEILAAFLERRTSIRLLAAP
jgi:hypothetical protein